MSRIFTLPQEEKRSGILLNGRNRTAKIGRFRARYRRGHSFPGSSDLALNGNRRSTVNSSGAAVLVFSLRQEKNRFGIRLGGRIQNWTAMIRRLRARPRHGQKFTKSSDLIPNGNQRMTGAMAHASL